MCISNLLTDRTVIQYYISICVCSVTFVVFILCRVGQCSDKSLGLGLEIKSLALVLAKKSWSWSWSWKKLEVLVLVLTPRVLVLVLKKKSWLHHCRDYLVTWDVTWSSIPRHSLWHIMSWHICITHDTNVFKVRTQINQPVHVCPSDHSWDFCTRDWETWQSCWTTAVSGPTTCDTVPWNTDLTYSHYKDTHAQVISKG